MAAAANGSGAGIAEKFEGLRRNCADLSAQRGARHELKVVEVGHGRLANAIVATDRNFGGQPPNRRRDGSYDDRVQDGALLRRTDGLVTPPTPRDI